MRLIDKKWGGLIGGFFVGMIIMPSISSAEGPTISGYINTTYTTNFNKPFHQTTALRSYDAKDNTFQVNSAHLEFAGSLENIGYNVQIDAGSDALVNTAAGGGDADDVDIQEAYLTYTHPPSKLGFKAGKFVTFMGIEVIESKDNPTISRGFLFGLAEPFTHTGAVATYQIGKFEMAWGAVNGFDVLSDNNDSKTAIGKLSANFGDPLFLTVSGAIGSEQANVYEDDPGTPGDDRIDNDGNIRKTVDLTGVTKIVPHVALWFQGLYGQEENAAAAGPQSLSTWSGFGIQPVWTISDKWSLGARYEYMDDGNGAKTGIDNSIISNITIAPCYKVSTNAMVRAEYRYDQSNQKLWEDDKDDGIQKISNSTASIELIVTF